MLARIFKFTNTNLEKELDLTAYGLEIVAEPKIQVYKLISSKKAYTK